MAEAAGVLGNPSSLHSDGRKVRDLVERSRRQVAALWRVLPMEVVFVSGGTEANWLALQAAWAASHGRNGSRQEIVISPFEHPSIVGATSYLGRQGATVVHTPLLRGSTSGALDVGATRACLSSKTALVSVQLANHETGNVYPVGDIAAAAHDVGALVHTDAVQAMGKMEVHPQALGVDLLSMSGHKIGGPMGVGALYVKRGLALAAPIEGGGQERGVRPGTENVLGIVGLGAACAALAADAEARFARYAAARARLLAGIEALPGAIVHGDRAANVGQTISVRFAGVPGDLLLIRLDLAGFSVSNGAACSSGTNRPSPVLLAMGLAESEATGALRISFGAKTTDEELAAFLAALERELISLRAAARVQRG